MSKLKIRYWLEADEFFNTTGKNTEKLNESIFPNVFPYPNSPPGITIPTLSRLHIFQKKYSF